MKPTVQADIERAVDVMRAGGVILYPTDTVWGLGCDASCPEAVRRVYAIKRRADSKALISLVGSRSQLEQCTGPMPREILTLIGNPDGRPVTVVYPHVRGLAPDLLASDGSAGLRLTSELFSSSLPLALGRPVVSTSANISGQPAPAFFDEIPAEILSAVDYAALYRREDKTPARPSKVVKFLPSGEIEILRP